MIPKKYENKDEHNYFSFCVFAQKKLFRASHIPESEVKNIAATAMARLIKRVVIK